MAQTLDVRTRNTPVSEGSVRITPHRLDLANDLILPTLMFMAVGGMSWAVRGCSGFGAVAGCLFAGVLWGATWWYLSYDPSPEQTRRYSSGWIVFAVTLGVGISGARGWMQWPSFFEGQLQTGDPHQPFLPIPRSYGFLWLFIAGVPWAGVGACMLAWCGSLRETRVWHWIIRITLGLGVAAIISAVYEAYPQYFLPLYRQYQAQYNDLDANPNLGRLIGDCRLALTHLGYFLGFLLFELIRRDWKNVVLISTVGLVNGAGWAACQNWKWSADVFPGSNFNFWRCWESSGGLSIGLAFGIAYFLVNRRMSATERAIVAARRSTQGPNYEWLLIYCGLAALSIIFLAGQLANWRTSYAVTAIAIAGIYYVVYQRKTSDGLPRRRPVSEMVLNVAGGSCVAAAFICYFLYSEPLRFWTRKSLRGLVGTKTMIALLGDVEDSQLRFALICFSVVVLLGLAYYLLRRRAFDLERSETTPADGDPVLERYGLYLGLLIGLGLSIRNGAKGWFNIYRTDKPETVWDREIWHVLGPVFLGCLILIGAWMLISKMRPGLRGIRFHHAYAWLWLVLIVQNVIAQMITGTTPLAAEQKADLATRNAHGIAVWNEAAFSIYYVLLFCISAAIAMHYRSMKSQQFRLEQSA